MIYKLLSSHILHNLPQCALPQSFSCLKIISKDCDWISGPYVTFLLRYCHSSYWMCNSLAAIISKVSGSIVVSAWLDWSMSSSLHTSGTKSNILELPTVLKMLSRKAIIQHYTNIMLDIDQCLKVYLIYRFFESVFVPATDLGVRSTFRTLKKSMVKLAKEENHLNIPMESQTKQTANSQKEVYLKQRTISNILFVQWLNHCHWPYRINNTTDNKTTLN